MRDKEFFKNLVDKNFSITDISKETGLANSTVRYWLNKYGLKTNSDYLLKNRLKYSDDELLEAWDKSDSINQFLKVLGLNQSGGTFYHFKKRLLSLKVDLSQSKINGRKRGGETTALIKNSESLKRKERLPRRNLKKGLDLEGVEYCCSLCGIKEWMNKKIKLQIHHKDLDRANNKTSNLEYLCPNCHSVQHYEEK